MKKNRKDIVKKLRRRKFVEVFPAAETTFRTTDNYNERPKFFTKLLVLSNIATSSVVNYLSPLLYNKLFAQFSQSKFKDNFALTNTIYHSILISIVNSNNYSKYLFRIPAIDNSFDYSAFFGIINNLEKNELNEGENIQ